jgi:hypothetical protein
MVSISLGVKIVGNDIVFTSLVGEWPARHTDRAGFGGLVDSLIHHRASRSIMEENVNFGRGAKVGKFLATIATFDGPWLARAGRLDVNRDGSVFVQWMLNDTPPCL